MVARRAFLFVGLGAMVALGGCVLLTGVNDLAVEAAGPEAGTVVTLPDGATGVVTEDGSIVTSPPEAGTADASADVGTSPPDSGPADASAPDATGPVDSGSTVGVRCTSAKTCSGDQNVCCYFPLGGFGPSCTNDTNSCAGSASFTCDGDEDCTGGKVCCVSFGAVTFQASSACVDTCAPSMTFTKAGLACAHDPDRCAAPATCKAAANAPPTILACQ